MPNAVRDENRVQGLIAETNDSNRTPSPLVVDPATKRLFVTSTISNLGGLVGGVSYDYISLGYTGSNLTTVAYKVGGVGGTTVASLTLSYDGSNNLLAVTRTA
jgi:hypothetical protein